MTDTERAKVVELLRAIARAGNKYGFVSRGWPGGNVPITIHLADFGEEGVQHPCPRRADVRRTIRRHHLQT